MSNLKSRMLLGACLAVSGAVGFAATADAATNKIYGGGSSLIAPYARQAEDCYGQPAQLVTKAVPPVLTSITPFNYTGNPAPFDCSTQHVSATREIRYISTGSGTGVNAVYSNDPSLYGDVDPNTAGNQFYPGVQYGFSDTSLDSNDVNVYNNGGGGAGTHVGITVKDQAGGGGGTYDNPFVKFGPLVQFPVLIAPVAIVYDPVYKKVRQGDNSVKEYKFYINAARADGSGGLRLDADTYCKIFNGQITNWNDPALKALNGNKPLKDPTDPTKVGSWSVPMQIVGRFESSGTTSIFTRHMAAVCSGLGGNAYADATTTLPASLHTANGGTGAHYDKNTANDLPVTGEALGQFTLADGNDGVAKYVDFTVDPGPDTGDNVTQGRIAYAGADYALPGAVNNPSSPAIGLYALNSADLKNSGGRFKAPTPANALTAFGSLAPPQSLANGHYDSGSADPHHRANPQDWVEPASKNSVLANPDAANGYPIVGTTNFLGYQCYATNANRAVVNGLMDWYMSENVVSQSTLGLLAKAGLAPLPKPWRVAIRDTFTSNTSGLNLNFANAGTGACANATHGG